MFGHLTRVCSVRVENASNEVAGGRHIREFPDNSARVGFLAVVFLPHEILIAVVGRSNEKGALVSAGRFHPTKLDYRGRPYYQSWLMTDGTPRDACGRNSTPKHQKSCADIYRLDYCINSCIYRGSTISTRRVEPAGIKRCSNIRG